MKKGLIIVNEDFEPVNKYGEMAKRVYLDLKKFSENGLIVKFIGKPFKVKKKK